MLDSFVPSSGNTWDKSFNSSFTSECGNAEPADAITPGLAINNIPASGASGEVIDIPPPAPASDFSLILLDTPLQAQADITTNRHETQAVDALTR